MYEIDEQREELQIQEKYEELLAACKQIKKLTPQEEEDIFRAYAIAKQAHNGTRRKSGEPYIFHPLAVALIAVKEIGLGPIAVICALLHDVVEDTEITLDNIRMLFGDRVATLVEHETAPASDHLTWREKRTIQVEQLASASYDCKVVAIGDKLSNLRGITRDCRLYGDATWKLFHAPNGKDDIEWYYRSMGEALRDLSETLAYKEFVWLLELTFG